MSFDLRSPAEKRATARSLLALRMARQSCTKARHEALLAARTADEYHLTEGHQRAMVALSALDDMTAASDAAIFANEPV